MKCRVFRGLTPLLSAWVAILALAILEIPVTGQSGNASPLPYNPTQEITLVGTVSSVLARSASGMILGSHLLLTTVSGTVDASLGRWGLQGKGALSVIPGQQVEVTGIMKTLKDKEVFVVRTVKVLGKIYIIRNEHGIPVSPRARQRAEERGAL